MMRSRRWTLATRPPLKYKLCVVGQRLVNVCIPSDEAMLGDAVEIRVGCLREMLKHTPYL